LTVSAAFTSSANSTTPHVIVTVQAPLLLQTVNDAPYFDDTALANTFPTITSSIFFRNAANGFAPSKVLASPGIAIGIAPYAGPLCPENGHCLTQQNQKNPPPSIYPYCASVVAGEQDVAAFLVIGRFGETYVSAPANPLGLLPTVSCAF
jgi:hypothetical protein